MLSRHWVSASVPSTYATPTLKIETLRSIARSASPWSRSLAALADVLHCDDRSLRPVRCRPPALLNRTGGSTRRRQSIARLRPRSRDRRAPLLTVPRQRHAARRQRSRSLIDPCGRRRDICRCRAIHRAFPGHSRDQSRFLWTCLTDLSAFRRVCCACRRKWGGV